MYKLSILILYRNCVGWVDTLLLDSFETRDSKKKSPLFSLSRIWRASGVNRMMKMNTDRSMAQSFGVDSSHGGSGKSFGFNNSHGGSGKVSEGL